MYTSTINHVKHMMSTVYIHEK